MRTYYTLISKSTGHLGLTLPGNYTPSRDTVCPTDILSRISIARIYIRGRIKRDNLFASNREREHIVVQNRISFY